MTTFFGMDAHHEGKFLEHGMICLDKSRGAEARWLHTFRGMKTEDVVFLKSFTPQSGLKVTAIGLSLSSFADENDVEICFPVEWMWMGEKLIEQANEELALCGNAFYEEHNIFSQRKIMDLLPGKLQLAVSPLS